MKKLFFLLNTILPLILSTYSEAASQDQSAAQIIRKATDLVDLKNTSMKISLKIYNSSGNVRVREINSYSISSQGATKTLIRFTSPPDQKGIAMLIHDYPDKSDDMWIYLPSLRKTRRMVSTEKGSSFMGSEFLNADMSRPDIEDFTYTFKKSSVIEGRDCWVIESLPVNETVARENGCSKKISYISKEDGLCYRTEYFDSKRVLERRQNIKKYKKCSSGRFIADFLESINEKNGRRSTIEISDIVEKVTLGSNYFEPGMLQ